VSLAAHATRCCHLRDRIPTRPIRVCAQAVGSLKAFAAGGTRAYRELFGWADTLSASPLGAGALQCMWRPPFIAQYLATVALPLLAAGGVIAIFLAVTAARQVQCSRRGCTFNRAGLRSAVAAWWGERRHVSTLMVRRRATGWGQGRGAG
jgi:hypothetical protein